MLPNEAVVSGWCNKISVSVSEREHSSDFWNFAAKYWNIITSVLTWVLSVDEGSKETSKMDTSLSEVVETPHTKPGVCMTTLALAHRANVDRLGNYGTIMRRGPQQHQKPRNFLNRMLMYLQHLAQEAFPPQDTDPIGFAVLLHRNSHELLAMPHIHSA